jgi:hypothetical protein
MAQQVLDTLAKIGDPETFGAHLLYLQGEALRKGCRRRSTQYPNLDRSGMVLQADWSITVGDSNHPKRLGSRTYRGGASL